MVFNLALKFCSHIYLSLTKKSNISYTVKKTPTMLLNHKNDHFTENNLT